MIERGHVVRATTRTEMGRAAIEASGGECWIGTPDRLATMRGALENVTIACWLLALATGTDEELAALHGSRLEYFLTQVIDTTVRGFIYEAPATLPASDGRQVSAVTVAPDLLLEGERMVRSLGERNVIPVSILRASPWDEDAWMAGACGAVERLLGSA